MALTDLAEKIRSYRIFRIFYWFLKISMGLAFITSGIRKLPGIKFTQLPVENPVGLFFEGMYVTGFYWNFIGYYQILTGLLLMTPWLKRLSPLLILPVTFNIWLVSLSLEMRGTPVITSLMLLANLFLIFWHIRSYSGIFSVRGS